jgi:succinate dehydrogenase/fumarate reductase flavoprotein subunit
MTLIEKDIVIIGAGTCGRETAHSLSGRIDADRYIILTKAPFVDADVPQEGSTLPIQYGAYALKLIVVMGRVQGVIVVDRYSGDVFCLKTSTVLLAAGGYEDLFNKEVSEIERQYGDGMMLAVHQGAQIEGVRGAIATDNGKDSIGGLKTGSNGAVKGVKGVFAVGSVAYNNSSVRISTDHMANVLLEHVAGSYDLISEDLLKNGCQKELERIRLIPDLDVVRNLQKHICELMWKNSAVGGKTDIVGIPQALHLIQTLKTEVERHAIEEYSERANIYQIIEMAELRASIDLAEIYLQEQLNKAGTKSTLS